jgi:hypothetical protein
MDDTPERRVWDERRPKDRVTLQIILVFTLYTYGPQNIYTGLSACKCKIKKYTLQQDKRKCKKSGCVSWICTSCIDTNMHNTHLDI